MDSKVFYSKVWCSVLYASTYVLVMTYIVYILYRAKARIIQHKAEQEIPIPSLRKSRKELHDRLKVKTIMIAHVSEN